MQLLAAVLLVVVVAARAEDEGESNVAGSH